MVVAYLACSLDGYIAGERGELDWLDKLAPPTVAYYDFSSLMADIDCVLMGANTFRKVLGFDAWPYGKKVFVYSSTVKGIPAGIADKAELVSGTPREVLDRLSSYGYKNIYIDGGKTVQSFLRAGLLDEMHICHVSKILGGGIPLFGALGQEVGLEVVEVKCLTSQMTMCRYRIVK